MTTKTLLSLATVSLLAFAAKADDPARYTVETTNSWFSVTAASVPLNATNWGEVKPTRPASVLNVDTTAAAPVTYDPTEIIPATSTRYRVKGNMTVTLNAGVPANNVFGETLPKAAIVAVAGSPNKWYAWHLTSASAGEWVEMTGHTPAENETYAVTIELTGTTVSYKVAEYQLSTASSSTTLDTIGGTSLSKVGLAGYGSFGDFGALGFDSFEVTATLTAEEMDAMGIDAINTAALNEVGPNGLTKWESIVLGLPNQSTKPYTAPVQTNNGQLGFTIGNVDTSKYSASGASVSFDVYEYDIGEQSLGTKVTATPVAAGSTALVDAPAANAGVKYYKIKISIANP